MSAWVAPAGCPAGQSDERPPPRGPAQPPRLRDDVGELPKLLDAGQVGSADPRDHQPGAQGRGDQVPGSTRVARLLPRRRTGHPAANAPRAPRAGAVRAAPRPRARRSRAARITPALHRRGRRRPLLALLGLGGAPLPAPRTREPRRDPDARGRAQRSSTGAPAQPRVRGPSGAAAGGDVRRPSRDEQSGRPRGVAASVILSQCVPAGGRRCGSDRRAWTVAGGAGTHRVLDPSLLHRAPARPPPPDRWPGPRRPREPRSGPARRSSAVSERDARSGARSRRVLPRAPPSACPARRPRRRGAVLQSATASPAGPGARSARIACERGSERSRERVWCREHGGRCADQVVPAFEDGPGENHVLGREALERDRARMAPDALGIGERGEQARRPEAHAGARQAQVGPRRGSRPPWTRPCSTRRSCRVRCR